MDKFKLYNDIRSRTDGQIYIGVVGPVRTGKSTFIRNFIKAMILPAVKDTNEYERIVDEMPQASKGRTVMTTEPKFIPKEGVKIDIGDGISVAFRLIDCVGYIVPGAQGIYENENERLVKTPWFEESIEFSRAAEYGTGKVIKDHSTIGIVVTTDGSIGELDRSAYLQAENKTIDELKRIRKPFVVIINTNDPTGDACRKAVQEIEEKYDVNPIPLDCEKMTVDDINFLLGRILREFPISAVEFYMPKWIEMLSIDNPIKKAMIDKAREIVFSLDYIKNIDEVKNNPVEDNEYIKKINYDKFDFSCGVQRIDMISYEDKYYSFLSEMTGECIEDEYDLIGLIKDMSEIKHEYSKYIDVLDGTVAKGYGIVLPDKEQIVLKEPELFKTGNKYGVKIKAESPSVHMIKVNIGTEISPVVGSEEQAKDLMEYINSSKEKGEIWDTNIFGKSIGQLVEDGIRGKMQTLNDDCQIKLQDTMQKVVNESSGGIVCLII